MFRTIEKRFALSPQGAKDFCKGVLFTTLLDIALMLPAVFVFCFLEDYLSPAATYGAGYYILLALAFMAVMYVVSVLQYRNTYTITYGESAGRRVTLAEKLRKLPLAFFGEKNLSDLTATIMDDCTDLEHTFSHAVPQLFASIISIALITAGLFFYNWQLTMALFWVVPVSMAIILLSKKMIRRNFGKGYREKREVTEQIQEGLDAIQEIKTYNKEDDYIQKLSRKIDHYEKELTRGELLTGVLVNGAQSILKLGLATVIIVGATLLASGDVSLFVYLIFLVVGSRVYSPVNEVMNNLAALFYLDVRIDRMNEMQSLPVQRGEIAFSPTGYDIEFDNVCFSYESGRQVLGGVSFTARQGDITALVGPSGSGKSTSAKLAARFWDIQSGTIRLGGADVSRIDPETLLRNYSIVFQDVVLFNASVIDNIRIGKRDATEEEVMRAARLAQCDEFVNKMPQKYQTIIGENGETLSGGERQRVSIARALLKNAPVVLLDEATASLDVENETKIQAGISELVRGKTVIIIAHRMRTIANADKVIVLSNGQVAEEGSPEELKRKDGIFARMVKLQENF